MGKKRVDYVLLFLVLLLAMFGLFMLYSTSAYNGEVKFHDPFYYLKKQLFASGLGIAGMFLIANIDYHFWQRLAVLGLPKFEKSGGSGLRVVTFSISDGAAGW